MKTVLKYLVRLNKLVGDKEDKINLVYRGQTDFSWSIQSSAYRRLEKNSVTKDIIGKDDFIKYHKTLLSEAKMHGFNYQDRKLEDLELLATLQHFGGATCLTDFTKNFLVSLWFASEISFDKENNEINGAVFVVDLNSPQTLKSFKTIETKHLNQEIEKLLKDSDTSNRNRSDSIFWLWTPENLNNRIQGQNSIFIFSLFPIDEKYYKKIEIDYNDKQNIRYELDKYFDINANTIFNDFFGFAKEANNCNSSFYQFSCSNHYDLIKRYLEEKDYFSALNNSIKGIDCIENDNKICEVKNKKKCGKYLLGDLYYFKGESLHYLEDGDLDKAINNYKKSIELNTDYLEDAYFRIVDIYYDKGAKDVSFYNSALDIMKEMNTEIDNPSTYISIVELSLLSENKGVFNEYIEKSKNSTNMYSDNGKYVIDFFDIIGQDFFNKKIIPINVYKNDLKKSIIQNFSFSFWWYLEDINNWLRLKKLNKYLSVSECLFEQQQIWLADYYSKSTC